MYKHTLSRQLCNWEDTKTLGIMQSVPYALVKPLDQLRSEQMYALFSSLVATVDHIHAIDLSNYTGYRLMDEHGTGMFNSWKESLSSLDNRKIPYNWCYLPYKLGNHCTQQQT